MRKRRAGCATRVQGRGWEGPSSWTHKVDKEARQRADGCFFLHSTTRSTARSCGPKRAQCPLQDYGSITARSSSRLRRSETGGPIPEWDRGTADRRPHRSVQNMTRLPPCHALPSASPQGGDQAATRASWPLQARAGRGFDGKGSAVFAERSRSTPDVGLAWETEPCPHGALTTPRSFRFRKFAASGKLGGFRRIVRSCNG